MKLSVVVPVYNEKNTLFEIFDWIQKVNLGEDQLEIVVVDDCSTDGTREVLQNLHTIQQAGEKSFQANQVKLDLGLFLFIFQNENQGKGGCFTARFSRSNR